MKGFEANAWWGLFAPAGNAAGSSEELNEALATALRTLPFAPLSKPRGTRFV